MISIVTTVRCGPVTLLARLWLTAFDAGPAAPASEGLPCPVDCSGDDGWGTAALFPEPEEDPPFSLLDLLGVPEFDTLGAAALGTAAPLSPLDLSWDIVLEAPGEPGLEEPLLPSVELFDPFEGELELACGEPFDLPASEAEGALVECETPMVPSFDFPVEKPFALPTGPGGWKEDPVSVGKEKPVVFCVVLTVSIVG